MSKGVIYLGAGIGSLIGSLLPVVFGSSYFGGWSILGSVIGGIAGIWLIVKIAG